ncbi:hypothetical protein JXQ70_13455 [bacterium]|nr:hypothetical protein [bacterium]
MRHIKATLIIAIFLVIISHALLFLCCSGDSDDDDDNSQPTPTPTSVVNTPPDTEITSGPEIANSFPVVFTFTGSDNEDTLEQLAFSFRIDSEDWSNWQSEGSASYDELSEGAHVFSVKARDSGGLEDETPAEWPFTVYVSTDSLPPETWIVSGPSGTIAETSVTFVYSGNDNETDVSQLMYSYEFSDWGWSEYDSATQVQLTGLTNGSYTFGVRARDQAGNVDPTPDYRTFTVNSAEYAIWLDPSSQSQNGNPGDELTYQVNIQNTGSKTGTFTFGIRDTFPSTDWSAFFCLSDETCVVSGTVDMTYGPGETDWMIIHIFIGSSAGSGDQGNTVLSAQCIEDSTVYEESAAYAECN